MPTVQVSPFLGDLFINHLAPYPQEQGNHWPLRLTCVLEREDGPWFVAADVCRALELTDTGKTVSLLDEDEKGTNTIRTPGGDQDMLIVSEPGLYSLILRSRKPEAKQFKRWITHTRPSLRLKISSVMPPSTSRIFGPRDDTVNALEIKLVSQRRIAPAKGCMQFIHPLPTSANLRRCHVARVCISCIPWPAPTRGVDSSYTLV